MIKLFDVGRVAGSKPVQASSAFWVATGYYRIFRLRQGVGAWNHRTTLKIVFMIPSAYNCIHENAVGTAITDGICYYSWYMLLQIAKNAGQLLVF